MIPFKKSLPVIFIILLLLLHNSALNSMASFNDPRYLQELATLERIPLENISQHYPPEQVSYMTGLKYIQGLGIEKNIKKEFKVSR